MIFFLAVLLVAACSKNDDENATPVSEWSDPSTGNFINQFITEPEKLVLEYVGGNDNYSPRIKMALCNSQSVGYASTDTSKFALYKKYAAFYGDTAYHDVHVLGATNALASPLSSISIQSDTNLDEEHKSGEPLNGLFLISYPRYYQYIKNGYKPQKWYNSCLLDSISELSTFKDEYLFEVEESFLIFKQQPAPGKYTFTVTLDFGEDPLTGEKVTVPPASIEIEF